MRFYDEIVSQEKLAEFDRFYTSYIFMEITRTIKIVNCFEQAQEVWNLKAPIPTNFQLNEIKRIEQKKLRHKDESNYKLEKEISQMKKEEIELRSQLKKSREERIAYENELKMIAAKKAKKLKK